METRILQLLEAVEHCLLPKLAKNFNESEVHQEIETREKRLDRYFPELQKCLEVDLRTDENLSYIALSSLLILYKELQCDRPWNSEKSKDYLKKLDQSFQLIHEVSLNDLLRPDKENIIYNVFYHQFKVQNVFDQILEKLHWKLTCNCEDFKMYPSLIEVYCSIIEDIKKCNIMLNPTKTFPISLLMMDDHVITNKLKGLRCCLTILHCLKHEDFIQGNYYEVIYTSLKKAFMEKDLEATKLSCECLISFLALLPNNVQIQKADELYSEVLRQILTEANIYRKSNLFNFTARLIELLKVECVKRKMFTVAVCDNLEACCSEGVADVLLLSVLDCYEEWLKHCWCIWRLSKDQKLLQILFKVLLVCCEQEHMSDKIVYIISTLVGLCTNEEIALIVKDLSDRRNELNNKQFNDKVDYVLMGYFFHPIE